MSTAGHPLNHKHDAISRTSEPTSDLFNFAQELGGLQPLSFQGAGYTGIAR
jgi:hypothetical protein